MEGVKGHTSAGKLYLTVAYQIIELPEQRLIIRLAWSLGVDVLP